jgi:hypothetical protein
VLAVWRVCMLGEWLGALCFWCTQEMVGGQALEALLHTVGHDSSAAPRRIALFSLGNFAG